MNVAVWGKDNSWVSVSFLVEKCIYKWLIILNIRPNRRL
jgi:hypothetical protein